MGGMDQEYHDLLIYTYARTYILETEYNLGLYYFRD